LYIGEGCLGFEVASFPGLVVALDLLGMVAAVSSEVAGVGAEPGLDLQVAALEVAWIAAEPTLVASLLPSALAVRGRANGLPSFQPGIRKEKLAAEAASSSSLPLPAHHHGHRPPSLGMRKIAGREERRRKGVTLLLEKKRLSFTG